MELRKTQLPPTLSPSSKQSKSTPRWCSALATAIPVEPAPITQVLLPEELTAQAYETG